MVPALVGAIIGGIGGFIVGTVTEAGRLIDQGGDYDWQAGALNLGNSTMAGFVGGGVLGGTGNPALAGMAGGASYGLLDGVAHTDPQGSFADNSLMVLQSTAIGGMAGGMGGLAGGGVAGALAGTSLSMTTQAFLAGSAAGIYGGSTARILSGTGITPVTVTQDAFMGGANGLIFYGVASAYQQATAPKPSTTSLQERANLAAELSEAEGCEGRNSVIKPTQEGVDIITEHLSGDMQADFNDAMIRRIETVLQEGGELKGPDAEFYFHEIEEAGLMNQGLDYDAAHNAALDKYQVTEFDLYHPDVIKAMPEWFSPAWFEYWNIGQ